MKSSAHRFINALITILLLVITTSGAYGATLYIAPAAKPAAPASAAPAPNFSPIPVADGGAALNAPMSQTNFTSPTNLSTSSSQTTGASSPQTSGTPLFAPQGKQLQGTPPGASTRQAGDPGSLKSPQFGKQVAPPPALKQGQQTNQQGNKQLTPPSAIEESPSQSTEQNKSTTAAADAAKAAPKVDAGAVDQSAVEKTFSEALDTTQKSKPQSFAPGGLSQFGYSFFRPESFTPQVDVPVGDDYVVGPGDSIVLTVWGSHEGVYNLDVSRSGEVVLPQFGSIKVAGVRFGQLPDIFRTNISRVYKDYKLSVNIGRLRQIKVYLVGEVRSPGDYNISSMATLINSLAAAGGPTRNGSLRNIVIKRNGTLVNTVDLYDFFLNGDKSRDVRLQSGDTVLVPSIGPVAGIAGTVRRPGIYELKGSASLKTLLDLSGGLLPTTYLQRIQITRLQAHEKVVVLDRSINPRESGKTLDELLSGIEVSDQDLVKIFPIDRTQRGYIRLNGYITRPGDYALKPGLKISDLLKQDNLLPEFSTQYAQIVRIMPPDYHPEVIIFSVKEALGGNPKHDHTLQEFDEIRIYSRWELEEMPMVSISGEVHKPGAFRLMENMSVRDLLVLAQNTRVTAYLKTAEIKRHDFSNVNITPYSVYINLEEAIKGNPEHDLKLQKYDELVIKRWYATEELNVTISGEVRQPGSYRFVDNMTVRDLVIEAGSPMTTAYLTNAEIKRYDFTKINITPSSIYINLQEALNGNPDHNLKLQKYDELVVKRWYATEEQHVVISGEVRQPGSYRFVENMTVRDLVIEAGSPKDTAYLTNAEIKRYDFTKINITPSSIYINLQEALKGNPEHNLKLQKFDEVFVKKWFSREEYPVYINGEVRAPGSFRYVDGMTLRDLVIEAGNLKFTAYLKDVEINRRKIEGSTITTFPINVSLDEAMSNDPKANAALQPFDTVVVRKIPDWAEETERYVTLKGEFTFPGTYPIFKGERLSAVIKRAGGFTTKAYLSSAKFIRASVREQQQKRMDEFLMTAEQDVTRKTAEMGGLASSPEELAAAKLILEGVKQNLQYLKSARAEGRVVTRLTNIEAFTGSKYDIEVMAGDVLEVPQSSNAISVLGRVVNPTNFIALEDHSVNYYLGMAGGTTKDSEVDELYVIRADGSIFSRQQYSSLSGLIGIGFFNETLAAGDAVVVPQRFERIPWMRNIKDITTIMAQLAISAGTVMLGLR